MSRRATSSPPTPPPDRGAALIVVLWTLLVLGVLVGGFAFNMEIEARVTAYQRRAFKAEGLARAGIEWARSIIMRSATTSADDEDADDEDPVYMSALQLARGVGVRGARLTLGDGTVTVDIAPEESRRNVNRLTDDEWEEILDQSGVPSERWDELVDCFRDWTDENDEHRANGAEKDDPEYRDRNYEPKNGPVDTIDELRMIKGFDDRILYGGPADNPDDPPFLGIARWLTVWGDGQVNLNTASAEVLMTIPGIEASDVEEIIAGRAGPDKEFGTRDDGYESVEQALAVAGLNSRAFNQTFTVKNRVYLHLRAVGEVGGVKRAIQCVMRVDGQRAVPVFWREDLNP